MQDGAIYGGVTVLNPSSLGINPFGASVTRMTHTPSFPATRMRRLRRHAWSRAMVAESALSPADFIWPLFVIDGEKETRGHRFHARRGASVGRFRRRRGGGSGQTRHSGALRCSLHRSRAENARRARSDERK